MTDQILCRLAAFFSRFCRWTFFFSLQNLYCAIAKCARCTKHKISCEGCSPCQNCAQKKIPCVPPPTKFRHYPGSVTGDSHSSSQATIVSPQKPLKQLLYWDVRYQHFGFQELADQT